MAILLGVGLVHNAVAGSDTWNGGGADNNWQTANNWGGTAPSAGDSLAFTGTTRLSPNNNFTAGTTFSSLTFNSGAGAFTLGGNSINLGSAGGSITDNSASAETVSLNLVLTGSTTFSVGAGTAGSLTINSAISGTGPLTIAGANPAGTSSTTTTAGTSVTLGGSNTFTGATTLTGGSVTLNYGGNVSKLDAGSSLTLGGANGGVALTVSGSAAANQTVASTVIAAGNNSIAVGPSGANLNLGSVTGTDGGVLNLVSGNITGTITATSNTNGILGGFAIWTNAAQNPSTIDWVGSTGNGSAVAVGDYTGYNTGAANTWTSSSNVAISSNQAPSGSITINSLKFSGTTSSTLTLASGISTITTGGILSPATALNSTITGGTLTTSAADFYIYTNGSSNTITIGSSITGNEGLVIAPISANSNATVLLSGGTLSFGGNIAVTRANLSLAEALPTAPTGKTITLNTVVGSSVVTTLIDSETTGSLTINAANYQIVGNGSVTKNNATGNTLALLGAHAYTGVTTDAGGVLQADTLANGGSNSSIGAASSLASNLVLANGATLQYVGSGGSTDRLFTMSTSGATSTITLDGSGTGAAKFINAGSINFANSSSGTTSPLLVLTGSNTGANTLTAALANNGTGVTSLTKTGTGVWIDAGANSYTGSTTISNGILYANGGTGTFSGSSGASTTIAGSTTITVGSTAGLVVGQTVSSSSSNLAGTAVITGIISPTTFTVSSAVTGTGTTTPTLTYGSLAYAALGNGGNVNVAAAGTLAGNGTIALGTGNAITLASSAGLTPGGIQTTVPFTGTPGTVANGSLTVTPATTGTIMSITSANLTFALGAGNATSGSKLVVGGSLANTIAFSGTSTVTINDLVGANLTLNQEYELIVGNGSTTFTGLTLSPTTTALGQQIIGGLQLLAANTSGNFYSQWYNASQLYYNSTTNSIDVDVVPEPSTWALIFGGLGVLVFWQRRTRRS